MLIYVNCDQEIVTFPPKVTRHKQNNRLSKAELYHSNMWFTSTIHTVRGPSIPLSFNGRSSLFNVYPPIKSIFAYPLHLCHCLSTFLSQIFHPILPSDTGCATSQSAFHSNLKNLSSFLLPSFLQYHTSPNSLSKFKYLYQCTNLNYTNYWFPKKRIYNFINIFKMALTTWLDF